MSAFVQQKYNCPITNQIMNNPVTAICGHDFEKKAILEKLSTDAPFYCPLDNALIKREGLKQNSLLKKEITHFLKNNSEMNALCLQGTSQESVTHQIKSLFKSVFAYEGEGPKEFSFELFLRNTLIIPQLFPVFTPSPFGKG